MLVYIFPTVIVKLALAALYSIVYLVINLLILAIVNVVIGQYRILK